MRSATRRTDANLDRHLAGWHVLGVVVGLALTASACSSSGSEGGKGATTVGTSPVPLSVELTVPTTERETSTDAGVCGGSLVDPSLASYCGAIGTPDDLRRDDVTITWGSADSYSQGKRAILNDAGDQFFVLVVHAPADAYLLAKQLGDGTLAVVDVLDLHEDNDVVDGTKLQLMDEVDGPAVAEYKVVGEHFVSTTG